MAGNIEHELVRIAMEEWQAGNLSRAEELLIQAAEAGNGHAAHNLRTVYATGGPGVELDPGKSRYWYEKALASGFKETVASESNMVSDMNPNKPVEHASFVRRTAAPLRGTAASQGRRS